MPARVINGSADPKYKFPYVFPGASKPLYFTHRITFENLGPSGTINPSTLKTELIYEKPEFIGKSFVQSAILEPDGIWRPLKESEARYINPDGSLGSVIDPNSSEYVLGSSARQSLSSSGLNTLNTAARQNGAKTLEKGGGITSQQALQAYHIAQSTDPTTFQQIPPVLTSTQSTIASPPAATPAATTATPDPEPSSTPLPAPLENLSETQFASANTKDKNYGILRYPINQSRESTFDYLKIDVVKYLSSKLIQDQNQISFTRPSERLRGVESLGTVILPMQPNISDSNGVSWNEDQLNALQGAFAAYAYRNVSSAGEIQNGSDLLTFLKSAGSDLVGTLGALANDPGMSSLISGYFAGQAVGANVIGRATGAVINNNLELLFHGPKLRTFRYSYKFTPREKSEAETIKKIIRLFKREMATSQSDTGLFLQTPNVFKLKYIYNGDRGENGDQHPYLNLIKPCALTNFSVNYTPDGTYMTYANGGSMTSYQVDMEFSELEPIYKNDYDDTEGQQGMGY